MSVYQTQTLSTVYSGTESIRCSKLFANAKAHKMAHGGFRKHRTEKDLEMR